MKPVSDCEVPQGSSCGRDLAQAVRYLREGKLVAIPTETVYGLAANGLDASAVLSIFQAKNRPHFDPLILHVASLDAARSLVKEIPEKARELANAFWPGPLTLLLEKTDEVPDLVTSGLPRVAIRVPRHPLTQALLKQLDFPLAAPSANPFGYVSPTTALHVQKQLGEKVAYILDGSECDVGIESTIIGFDEGKPVVFRLGGLQLEQIEAITGQLEIKSREGASPVAPGMIKSHYAPAKLLELGDIEKVVKEAGKTGSLDSLGILSFSRDLSGSNVGMALRLSSTGNLEEAAHNLFSCLRQLDESSVSRIVAERVPDTGLGRAINDRLQRASAEKG